MCKLTESNTFQYRDENIFLEATAFTVSELMSFASRNVFTLCVTEIFIVLVSKHFLHRPVHSVLLVPYACSHSLQFLMSSFIHP